MQISAQFGAAVRAWRESLGLSQEDLASKAGLDRTYISGVERGVRNPSLKSMQQLAKALGVELYQLVQGNRPPLSPEP